MKKLTEFKVHPLRGYAFPLDMLRYDACWPAKESETAKIYLSLDHNLSPASVIRLETYAVPTPGRWLSSGWEVVK